MAALLGALVVAPTVSTAGHAPSQSASAACTKAPAYRGTGTKFGTNLSVPSGGTISAALSRQESKYGRLSVVRYFDGSLPPDNAWKRRTSVIGNRSMVTSFRMPPQAVLSGRYDAAMQHFFSTAPSTTPIFWTYYHEPEPHIDRREFTAAQYRAAWQRLVGIAARSCKSNLFPTLILTGWTTDSRSHRNWRDYYAGDNYISMLAFDPYNKAGFAHPDTYPNPADIYDSVVRVANSSGKPYGIAETGSGLVPGDRGAGRAAWLGRVGAYFKSHGASWVNYFDSDAASDFRLDDAASIAAWRKVVSG